MAKELPKPQDSPAAPGEASITSAFDDGVLDATEKRRIRDFLSSAVTFLASRRLLPAFLVRVGPLRVLLPIVWGLGFLKSKRWASGLSFLGIGLFSLIMAFGPQISFETQDAKSDASQTVENDETSDEPENADSKVSSFLRPATNAASMSMMNAPSIRKPAAGSSFHEPFVATNDKNKSIDQNIQPAAAVTAKNAKQGGVWLLGTIEEVEENSLSRRTAANIRDTSFEQ